MNRGSITPRRDIPRMSRDIVPRHVPVRTEKPVLLTQQPSLQAVPPTVVTQVTESTAHITTKESPRWKKNRIFIRFGMPGIAGFFIVAGAMLTYLSFSNNALVNEQVKVYASSVADSGEKTSQQQSTTSQTSSGGSTSASDEPALSTDPTKPRGVTIPSIGVNAPTTIVGLNSKKEVGTPANIHYTSWYEGSSSPLDKAGTSLIVGHKGTDRYAGVFARIDQLKKGANIVLTMGDGQTITYAVVSVDTVDYDKVNMSNYLSYFGNTKRKLYLISCDGTYNETTHSYPKRVIVQAEGL